MKAAPRRQDRSRPSLSVTRRWPLVLPLMVLVGGVMKAARANNGGGWQQQPGGGYSPPPPPPPPPRGGAPPPPYQQQQQQPQDYAWGGMPPVDGPYRRGGPPPPPPSRQQPQEGSQQEGGGFWSRLTSKIFAGGDGEDNEQWGEGQQQQQQQYQQQRPPYQQRYSDRGPLPPPPPPPPPPPQAALPSSQHSYPSQQQFRSPQQQPPYGETSVRPPWQPPSQQQQNQEQGPGFWGKLSSKIISTTQNLLENKSDQQQQQQQPPPRPPHQQQYGGAPFGPPGHGGSGPPFGHPLSRQQQEEYGHRQQHQQQPPPPQFGGQPPPQPMGRQHDAFPPPPPPPPPAEEAEEESLPDVFSVGDNIVLVKDPRALREKIASFARAGPQAIEVLACFDGALKTFRTPDGKRRTETTTNLIHNAVLLPGTRAKITAIMEKYDGDLQAAASDEERYKNREDCMREVQRTLATEGQVYLPALPRAVGDFLSTVPLRAGIEQIFKPLAFHGVPLTVFCPGYGEVLSQILALSMPGLTGPEGFLPPNVRLVSNFFRAGPDGVVNGFMNPIVHELNLNMTTARQFRSGMTVGMGGGPMFPPRPPSHALVLGASLADLGLASGGGQEREVISLGFLETNQDFVEQLPKFLESYDAVVLGDGGLQYARHLIEQVVGTS